jgi:hypothetical protein
MRAKMVDWLIEVTDAYKCKTETFFLAIFIMDEYFKLCERSLSTAELHIIGVTCIFIACKYEEIHPLKTKTVVKDIAHNKIPAKDIVKREAEILITIGFMLERQCAYLKCK